MRTGPEDVPREPEPKPSRVCPRWRRRCGKTLEELSPEPDTPPPRGATVVNDCYNANPLSMRAALDDLATQDPAGRRVAVLGDMLELGPRDHVVEIGTGWGGFAVYAATTRGCRVTTTTISWPAG